MPTIVGVKKAVELARTYLSQVLEAPATQLLLEEVELSDDQQFWLITFSYPAPEGSSLDVMLGGNRAYKVVKLKARTGEFVSVKIRTLAAA
jgi:hypothetical protein